MLLEDEPETWRQLLDDPNIAGDDKGKENAHVLCGARYFDSARSRDKEGVDHVSCLVLDVDNDDPATSVGSVPTEEAVRTSLEGLRAIVYTSPSHRARMPRWRILLPLASPVPPKKHRALVKWLSENLVAEYPGCIDSVATGDPTRLGFVGVTKNLDDYKWWEQPGERFDWTEIHLEEETWLDVQLGGLERHPAWTDRASALNFAMRAYGSRGYEDVKDGAHRTDVLWHASLDLWWAWAAEDEDFVMQVLRHINEQFHQPKDETEIYRKMKEAQGRTVGPNRKAQLNGNFGSKREPANSISTATIKHLARRLKRSHKAADARVGDEMSRMIHPEAIADDESTWNSALRRVAQKLAENFLNDRPARIASFFGPCRNAMIEKGGETSVPTINEIEGWVTVRLEGEKKRRVEHALRAEQNTRTAIDAATGGRRDTKYTLEEWDTWQSAQGCGLSEKTVLLQSGKGTWVFLDGTWVGPYNESEFDAQGYTDLIAASDFIRSRSYDEEKGTWSYIPLKQLLQKYASKCEVQMDFTCERAWFRSEERTLVVAGPMRSQLEQVFHTDVDEWLRRMTGRETPPNEKVRQDEASTSYGNGKADDYDALCDWLACVPQVEHPCAALVATGPPATGKDLLGNGIGRVWKHGKNKIKAALGHFNSMLAKSPFIHVNEALPRGMTTSTLLRETLSDTEHVITLKNVDSAKALGCVRMLFTANNLDIFNKDTSKNGEGEKLQKNDVDALRDRFVHIYTRPAAAEYLQSLGNRHKDFVEKNMIAEHVLWLNWKRWSKVKSRGLRFLVQGRNYNVSNVIATNSNTTSDVCNALAEALCEQRAADFFVVRRNTLWVNATLIKRQIGLHNPYARYTDRDVTSAVSSVSSEHKTVTNTKNKRMRMWAFNTDALESWCRNTEVYAWEDVSLGLEKMNLVERESVEIDDEIRKAV